MARSSYRARWSNDFAREPQDVYAEKERRRAGDLIRGRNLQRYGVATPTPRQAAAASQSPFSVAATYARSAAKAIETKEPVAQPKKDDGGFSLKSAVSRVTPFGDLKQVAEGGRKILEGVDAVGDYTLRPLVGALAYTGAERRTTPQGQTYRESPSFTDVAQSLGKLVTRNPVESYREGQRAFQERLRDPELTAGGRVLLGGATDPTTYLGPGVIKGSLRFAPAAIRNSTKIATAARYIEDPARVTVPAVLGAAAAADVAERTNAPAPVQALAPLAGGLAGGLGGARYLRRGGVDTFNADLARLQGRPGREPVLGLQTEKFPGSNVQKQSDLARLRPDDIEERPDLFQARNADPGKSYSESRVKELEAEFDPNLLEPGSVVYDTSTGRYVVFSGHHRKELISRKSKQGVIPAEGTWEVYRGDLSNPADVAELQRLADFKNTTVATTTLPENIRIFRRARERGEETASILDQMRSVDRVERSYLETIADLPDDIIQRWSDAKAPVQNLGEIAKARRQFELTDIELRAIVQRYGPGGKGAEIAATALRDQLRKAGQAIVELRGKNATADGMLPGIDSAVAQILDAVDGIGKIEGGLKKARAALKQAQKKVAELNAGPAGDEIIRRFQEQINELERELADATNTYNRQRLARWQGTGGDRPPTVGGLPEANGSAAAAAAAAVESATGPRPAGTVVEDPRPGEWVDINGRAAEVIAPDGNGVRVRFEDGEVRTEQLGADMFGGTRRLTIIERPATQPKIGLEGGDRGQIVPSNQESMLPDMGDAAVPAPRPETTRVAFPSDDEIRAWLPSEWDWNLHRGQITISRRGEHPSASRIGVVTPLPETSPMEWQARPSNRAYVSFATPREAIDYVVQQHGKPYVDEPDIPTVPETSAPTPAPRRGSGFEMPAGTERSNPRYSYGARQFVVTFEDDLDRALYIVGGSGKSKAHERFMGALREYFPDRTDQEIVAMGNAIRERIKTIAKTQKTSEIKVTAGQHEIGPVERISEPQPFPKQINSPDGTVAQVEYGGREPQRAAQVSLPGKEGEVGGNAPKTAPVGYLDPDRPRTPGGEAIFGERGKTGADTPSSMPEAPPPREPGTPEAGLGNRQRAFGQEGDRVDLLLGKERGQAIADTQARRATKKGRLSARWKRSKAGLGSVQTHAVADEADRTDRLIVDTVNDEVDRIRFDADALGFTPVQDADGVWRIDGPNGRVAFEDVIERTTDEGRAAYEALGAPQKEIVDRLRRLNEDWNKTIEAHGGTVPMKEDIEQYFPRQVIGREVEGGMVAKNRGTPGGPRGLGLRRIGHRTQDAVELAAEEGIRYANPWDALKGGMTRKAKMAQDAYLANMIRPLAVPAGKSGFGFRPLSGNHPALDKIKYVGEADSGAALLGTESPVFPNAIADELDDILNRRSIVDSKPGRVLEMINTITTPLRASADVSFILNQGLGMMESSPANAKKAITGSVRVIKSALGDPQQYADLRRSERARTRSLLAQAGIDDAAEADRWLVQRGKHYAGEDSIDEFLFPDLAKDILRKGGKAGRKAADVLEFSNETFARYLNYARDVLANDALEQAIAKGLRGKELDDHMRTALNGVNRMTGWTGTRPTGLERIGMFAPRFFRSNIEQIATAFTSGDIDGQIARRHLGKMLGIAAVTAYGINAVRGYNTDVDPRSYNFLRIRDVAGRDISLLGPFATIVRGGAQLVGGDAGQANDGPLGRGLVFGTNMPKPDFGTIPDFARTKASPTLATAWTLLSGSTFDDQPVERDPLNAGFWVSTVPNIVRENIPFSAQAGWEEGASEAIRTKDPLKVLTGIAAMAFSGTGAIQSQTTPSERRDILREKRSQRLYGQGYQALTATQKAEVNADAEIRAQQDEATRRGLDRDDKRVEVEDNYRKGLEASARYLAAGVDENGERFNGEDYRESVADLAAARFAALQALGQESSSTTIGRYFALREEATMANGQVNFDKLERLQADFTARNPDIDRELEKWLGTRDDAAMKRLRVARKQAKSYFDIPAYAGMTVEQGERIQEVLALASDMVSNRQVGSYREGLAKQVQMGLLTEAEMNAAIRAQRAGTNPERKAYALSHPEFAEFYRGYDPTFGELGAAGLATSSGGGWKPQPISRGGSSRRRSSSRRRDSSRRRSA